MISINNQISLTYYVGGEYLVKAGLYKSATENKGLVVIKQPEFKRCIQSTTLSTVFTEMCLTRPERPKDQNINRWFRTDAGKLFLDWKKLSVEEKVRRHVESYVSDMGGELISYSVL
jgi:hypothetical protein